MTSLGGDGPLDRREIHAWTPSAVTAFVTGTRRTARCWRATTRSCASSRCCVAGREQRAPESIRYHHEVLDWQQSDAGVVVTVHDRDTDEEFTVRARYVIAADGGQDRRPGREGGR